MEEVVILNSVQQAALNELKEKIVESRLKESDTSWIETEEELNRLKEAIIKELHIDEQNLYNGETRIKIQYYHTLTEYIIMEDGSINEYPIEIEKGLGGFRTFLLIMILVYFLAFIIAFKTFSAVAFLIIIVLGIINLVLFFNCE